MNDQPAVSSLVMRSITKSFTGVTALDGVSFDCRPGEIHAICGENGAGKSTLIKVLGGVHRPDSGEIVLRGRPVSFTHPLEARRAGISVIHQELSLLPERDVAQNIFLGREPTRFFRLDHAAMREGARAALGRLSSRIDPRARVADLSIAERQIVEIAKALALDADIFVFDEPTAALDETESRRLLDLIRRLKEQNAAIIYISHRMKEVLAIADRVTVLKDGRHVATRPAADLTIEDIVRQMVGRDLADFFPPRAAQAPGETLLEVRNGGNERLARVYFSLRAGEIVGVAGLEGSGKTALAEAILGDVPFTRGAVRFLGRESRGFRRPRRAIRAGLGYAPGDRKREGLTLQQSVRDNSRLTQRAMAFFLTWPTIGRLSRRKADRRLTALDVRAADFGQEIRRLSGGNQQKTILARWLARDPRALILVEPTRGVDVAAKAAIYRIMREAAARGRGVLMISSDLQEVVGVSDRILVMREGTIVGERAGGASEEAVMALAVGGHDDFDPLTGEAA